MVLIFKNDLFFCLYVICCICIENFFILVVEDGFFYFIDFVGLEVVCDKFIYDVVRMREVREINISFFVLKDCIRGRVMVDFDFGFGKKVYVLFR